MSVVEEDEFVGRMDTAVDFLAHYGVKGMKWGKRKKRPDEAERAKRFGPKSKSGVLKEAPSEDAAKVGNIHSRVATQKSTKMLTNKELQAALERMRLEQQYSQMTGGLDKTSRQKASSFVRGMVKNTLDGGQSQVQGYANNQVKDFFDKKQKSGKYDPLTVARRDAELKKLRAS